MKISTKGRYGIRAVFDLAQQGEGPIPLSSIARRQRVPEAYLEQLLQTLKRAGIVDAVRGAQGGYRLAKPPRDVSVGDVLHALEGSVAPSECVLSTDSCERSGGCAMRLVYRKINESIENIIGSTTFQDVLDDQRRLDERAPQEVI